MSMQSLGSRGSGVAVFGARELSAALAGVSKDLKRKVNGDLRWGSQGIAKRILIPELEKSAASAPNARFATRFADAMKVSRSDRLVAVRIPAENPQLSGLVTGRGKKTAKGTMQSIQKIDGGYVQTTRQATTAAMRATLAWGSEFGPYPGARVNHYGVPRNESGYWVKPAVARKLDEIKASWLNLVREVFRENGLTYGFYGPVI